MKPWDIFYWLYLSLNEEIQHQIQRIFPHRGLSLLRTLLFCTIKS